MAVFKNRPPVVLDQLTLAVDTINPRSYTSGSITWYDLSGNAFNGTLTNNPTFSISPFPLLDFTSNPAGTIYTGTNQAITFPASCIPTSGSFSIETWMWRDATTVAVGDRESIFSNASGGDGFRFQVASVGGSNVIYCLIAGAGTVGFFEGNVGTNYNIADARWHHVVCVFDRASQLGSSAIYGYVDGVLRGTVSIASSNVAFTPNIPGISQACCSKYRGKIAKLFVYKKALSQNEVVQNYNANKTFFSNL